MDSFTSTGLYALAYQALNQRDPALVSGFPMADPLNNATINAAHKRAMLERALNAYGPGVLLDIGQHLHEAPETPVFATVIKTDDTGVIAQKWMRLERYCHSTNRTRIEQVANGWDCTRFSTGRAPTLAENALIAGLLTGIAGYSGHRSPVLVVGAEAWAAETLATVRVPAGETLTRFTIRWQETTGVLPPEDRGTTLPQRLVRLLSSDAGRGWRIADAARGLGQSTRSLQRHLASEGRSFSTVLRQARMRAAVDLLTETATPLAEIGYCCGYADQAHFQRDFLRATNVTPARFRQIDSAGGSLPV